MKRAVCLFMQRQDGKILAVSRKTDRTQFGLPGGKVDPGESDEDALVREVKEETGLYVTGLHPLFVSKCVGEETYECRTYFSGFVAGEEHTDEPIDIRWVEPQVLLDGPFGKYMGDLFDVLGVQA